MIKKYNQFVNSKLNEGTEVAPSETEIETPTRTRPSRPSIVPTEKPGTEDAPLASNDLEVETEEGGEYLGYTKMKKLALALGLSDNDIENGGGIEYNGNKINFFSETNKFHIGKRKFNTEDEVVKFLDKPSNNKEGIDPELEAKSYKITRDKRINENILKNKIK
jgi:hypothetical protein